MGTGCVIEVPGLAEPGNLRECWVVLGSSEHVDEGVVVDRRWYLASGNSATDAAARLGLVTLPAVSGGETMTAPEAKKRKRRKDSKRGKG